MGRPLRNTIERGMGALFFLCGVVSVAFVALICLYLVLSGFPAIEKLGLGEFLFGSTWAPTHREAAFGILPFLLTSLYGTAGAIALGVPIGLFTAIYLAKLAPPRVAAWVRGAVELLAGIPSVVFGLVGMSVLVPALQRAFSLSSGACLLAAVLVLAVMILPTIISVSETALAAVPRSYEEASLALGATRLETIFRVSVPAARSGIAAGVILGVGRAVGEAMAVILVSGNVANLPELFAPVRFLTTAIASEMSYASVGSLHRDALYSIGLVLFLFILLINALLRFILKKGKEAGR